MDRRSGSNHEKNQTVEEVTIPLASFPEDWDKLDAIVEVFESEPVQATHPAEADLFARHIGIPAHNQAALGSGRIVLVGAGGLNSQIGYALIRSGSRLVTICDADRVERTNLSRQFFFEEDLGQPKGIRLARNLRQHAMDGCILTGMALPFDQAMLDYLLPADIFVAGVDNNLCRLLVAQEARKRRIPAVFTMLSSDGMRCHVFLQGVSPDDPCLWCALPNLDVENSMQCVSAVISACFMASAFTVFFVHRALMGWGQIKPFNWREDDLTGQSASRIGNIRKRSDCAVCQGL